jgi:hypothetical protein
MPIWVLNPYVYGFRTQSWVLWHSLECDVLFSRKIIIKNPLCFFFQEKKNPLEAGRNPCQPQPLFTSLLRGFPPGNPVFKPACWKESLPASWLGRVPPRKPAFKPARRKESLPKSWCTYQLFGRDSFQQAGQEELLPTSWMDLCPTLFFCTRGVGLKVTGMMQTIHCIN